MDAGLLISPAQPAIADTDKAIRSDLVVMHVDRMRTWAVFVSTFLSSFGGRMFLRIVLLGFLKRGPVGLSQNEVCLLQLVSESRDRRATKILQFQYQ
jgi:hypothetical protein